MPKIIQMNILDVTEGIILHQCNNRGVMESGLAKQIRNKYPEAYELYRENCSLRNFRAPLGEIYYKKVNNNLWIANAIAQDGYGRDKVYTDYDALRTVLHRAYNRALLAKCNLYIPYKIGCGLAGDNWDTVLRIIEEVAPEAIICKL